MASGQRYGKQHVSLADATQGLGFPRGTCVRRERFKAYLCLSLGAVSKAGRQAGQACHVFEQDTKNQSFARSLVTPIQLPIAMNRALSLKM